MSEAVDDWLIAEMGRDPCEFYVIPSDVTKTEFRMASLITEAEGWAQTKSTILDNLDLARACLKWLQFSRREGYREGVEEAERDLLGLLRGEWSSLILGMNEPNAANYMTVEQAVDDEVMFGGTHWVSEDEKAKAIANNKAWTLQWYPETPIGFHRIAASSLTAILAHVRQLSGPSEGKG